MNFKYLLIVFVIIGTYIGILHYQYNNLQKEYKIVQMQYEQEKINNEVLLKSINDQNKKINEASVKALEYQESFVNISNDLNNIKYSPFQKIENLNSNEDIFKWLLKNSSHF